MDDRPALGKPVSASRTELSLAMLPQDANPYGSIHGGVILKNMDAAAAMAAMRHCRGNAVTVAMDGVSFLAPSRVGELVTFRAQVNHVGRTSMEVGVRVESENLFTGEVRHTASAYLTFVALDVSGKPSPAPPLVLETDDERRRFAQAEERRRTRRCCVLHQGA
ncbi:putative acyl-CoA thioester hydrolase [Fundidesulfovibrio magnetotacticus]|uniref:Putative acyl-CoA thioester hydrolase n=1 Tax=Fundidesulfovibrio magnetotacticus TaxID=2730080 RepID=A0A6V8LSE8_9BACT|nr:acyl-CoA thioesterase [Fundidesulfovibrio magnetotacticus]GFK92537.1 putative acyl-CoA thioester hydrolase [Fundidesulfovibrio magnetotacticus]